MKFSIKLPLLFLSLSLVMLGVVTAVAFKGKDILQDRTLLAIEREATLLIRLIERNLFERYHDVQAFRLSLGEVDDGQLKFISSSPSFAANLNDFVRNYKVYRRIMIFDLEGELLAYSTKNQFGKTIANIQASAKKVQNSEWFVEATAGNTLVPEKPSSSYVIGPERFLIDDNPGSYDMIFASLIYDNTGAKAGLWVNVVDFYAVESIVAESYELLSNRGFVNSELTILDSVGRIIVDYDPVGQGQAKYHRDFDVLSQLNLATNGVEGARLAVAGLSGSNISTHFRKQVDQVTGYAHTQGAYDYPGIGWSALIRISVDDAFEASNALFRTTFVISLVLLAIVLLVSFYLGRRISAPLSDLSLAIKGLAHGERDIILPPVKGQDELALMTAELENLKNIVVERALLSRETDEQRFMLDIQNKAIDSTTSGIVVSDATQPDFPIIFANKAFELQTGYARDEVIGRNCRFLQNEDRDQPGIDTLRSAVSNQESCSVVLRNYRKDGTLFYNNLKIDPAFNDDGVMTHYIGVLTDVTEMKRRETETKIKLEQEIERRTQEVRESETRLRTVFDTALDGTVVIDNTGIILDINRSTELIFGRIREELIGENVAILMPAPYANEHDDYLTKFMLTGNKKLIGTPRQVEGLHKSGRVFPIEVSVGETKVGDSQVFVGVIKDITVQEETKAREAKLQDELRERELIYRAAFSQAAVGICRVALDGSFIEVNDKMCQIFGFNENELLSMTFGDITHPTDQIRSREMVTSLIEGDQRTFTMDKRYINKAGETFWATLSVSVVVDENEHAKYFISVIEDITNRKKIEKELRTEKVAREQLLRGMRLASDAGGICNWVLNAETGELKWDESMYQLYGIELDAPLFYEDWKQTLHPDDLEHVIETFTVSLAEENVFNAEFRIINQRTKQTRWLKAAADVVFEKESGSKMVFGINLDVTDEKDAQVALERETHLARQANEAKSRFLATMSHEIRTPMNGVIGMVDLLKETPLGQDQVKMVSTIRDSSFSLLEIINDILDFSKIESGQMELDLTDVDILALIEKTIEALWVNAHQKSVGLYIDIDSNLPQAIVIDPVRTRQVLLNLLGNAIKFTSGEEKPGFVKVIVSFAVDTLTIRVEDNGVGMTAEQMERLFTPFTQADTSTTRKFGGTGLGLSISKSFVELMGGDIRVESEFQQGSRFTFSVPAHSTEAQWLFGDYELSEFIVIVDIRDTTLREVIRKALMYLHPSDVIESSDLSVIAQGSSNVLVVTDTIGAPEPFDQYRCLELNDSPASTKGYISPNKVVVGTHPLKPSELALGFAVLSGQESPDFSWSENLMSELSDPNGAHEKSLSNAVILCAEDQPTNRLVLSQQLTKLGYRHEITENGKQALERWMDGDYDLVLTDCHMPEMDGFELTSEIRRLEDELGLERTVIVAITANALVGEAEHCLEAGMDDYIAKPVELHTLNKVLSLRLRGKELRTAPPTEEGSGLSKPHSAHINYEHLANVIGSDDREMQRAVLSMFWQSVSQDIVKLERAIEDDVFEEVRSLSHGAKGAATSSGATALGEAFRQIEKEYTQKDTTLKLLSAVKKEMTHIEHELKSENII
ncbi:PAS domain S-box protein [Vibrio coralliilyticus]|uniref:Sensor protein FixL n=1 Tax=Vibrio coralliilyticus TaxID=190893 RepID=A0AAP6ZU33_9VIBR|nr:PAS domain S-box protein [Vibrio coralliilyticus]NOJ26265.1 PAS domain S-box protein [Vibrio coralliilyticus]